MTTARLQIAPRRVGAACWRNPLSRPAYDPDAAWAETDELRVAERSILFWRSPTGGDRTLGIVDFSIFPHVDHEALPDNSMANAERWAAGIPGPPYAIDDQTAIKVTDGTVEVVSEGHWKLFTP